MARGGGQISYVPQGPPTQHPLALIAQVVPQMLQTYMAVQDQQTQMRDAQARQNEAAAGEQMAMDFFTQNLGTGEGVQAPRREMLLSDPSVGAPLQQAWQTANDPAAPPQQRAIARQALTRIYGAVVDPQSGALARSARNFAAEESARQTGAAIDAAISRETDPQRRNALLTVRDLIVSGTNPQNTQQVRELLDPANVASTERQRADTRATTAHLNADFDATPTLGGLSGVNYGPESAAFGAPGEVSRRRGAREHDAEVRQNLSVRGGGGPGAPASGKPTAANVLWTVETRLNNGKRGEGELRGRGFGRNRDEVVNRTIEEYGDTLPLEEEAKVRGPGWTAELAQHRRQLTEHFAGRVYATQADWDREWAVVARELTPQIGAPNVRRLGRTINAMVQSPEGRRPRQ